MTETWQEFTLPSALPGGGGGTYPALAQYAGRLLHMLPTSREDNVTTQMKPKPHVRLMVDITFFDGAPIDRVLDKSGQTKAQLSPPLNAGETLKGMFVNQEWFTARLKDHVGEPGFPGIVGVLATVPTKGNPMWMLSDPTPQQLETVKGWFMWKASNPGAGVYVPAAPVQAPPGIAAPPAPAFSAPQPAAGYAPAPGAPFAQPPAATPFAAAAPAPYAPPAAPAAPAAQPGAEQLQQAPAGVPPWQR
jgi:hypothetical protein